MGTSHIPALHILFASLQSHNCVFLTSAEVLLKLRCSFFFFADQISKPDCFLKICSSSLHNFEVVQYCHDVLRHEHVPSVQCHSNDGNEHGI